MRLADLAGLGRSAGLALMACMAAPQAVQAQAARPNILFILADNLGYGELGAYGGGATRGAPTPRLDRLAAEGLRLTNMNMEAQCTPSRSSILTGRFAIRSGTHSVPFGGVADGLTQWEVTLAEALSAQAMPRRFTASGISAAATAACPTTRASTNGTASRAPPTRRCGPRPQAGRPR